jgi:hypothetical protein
LALVQPSVLTLLVQGQSPELVLAQLLQEQPLLPPSVLILLVQEQDLVPLLVRAQLLQEQPLLPLAHQLLVQAQQLAALEY